MGLRRFRLFKPSTPPLEPSEILFMDRFSFLSRQLLAYPPSPLSWSIEIWLVDLAKVLNVCFGGIDFLASLYSLLSSHTGVEKNILLRRFFKIHVITVFEKSDQLYFSPFLTTLMVLPKFLHSYRKIENIDRTTPSLQQTSTFGNFNDFSTYDKQRKRSQCLKS